jgi:copper transport protein
MLAVMTGSVRRRLGRFALAGAALAGAVALLAPASPLAAHAVLISANPPPGSLLEEAPAEVTVTFSEVVTAEADSIVVIDAEGTVVSSPAEGRGTSVSATLDTGATGWHAVSWWVVSTDGHPVSGAWTFRIGDGDDEAPDGLEDRAAAAARSSEVARWAYYLTQWASTLAAIVTVGCAFVALVLGVRPSIVGLWLSAAGAGAVWSVAAAAANGPYASVSGTVFGGPASDHYMGRALLLAVATGLVIALRGRHRTPERSTPTTARLAMLTLTLGALGLPVLVGHTSTEGTVATAAVIAHLAVAGAWLGATPAMLLVVRHGPSRSADLAAFSRAATWLLAGTVVAGGASVQLLTGGFGNATQSWGWTLFVKIALVGVAITAGAWNRWNVVPHADELPLPRATSALRIEVLALVGIVAASIALTHNGPPSIESPAARGPAIIDVTTDDQVRIQLIVDPARVGANDLHLFLLDGIGMPIDVEEVTLTLASESLGVGRIDQELSNLGAGHYSGRTDDLGLAGDWEVHVVVRPDRFSQVEVRETIRVSG